MFRRCATRGKVRRAARAFGCLGAPSSWRECPSLRMAAETTSTSSLSQCTSSSSRSDPKPYNPNHPNRNRNPHPNASPNQEPAEAL